MENAETFVFLEITYTLSERWQLVNVKGPWERRHEGWSQHKVVHARCAEAER